MTDTRTEQDFLGQRALPKDALYGINTQRAMENFALGQKHTELSLIHAMVQVKKASARTYLDLGMGNPHVFSLIVSACDDILTGAFDDAFVTEALQGGAGTSAHMNVNEVIANDCAVTMAASSGNFELNPFLPLIADCLLDSLKLLSKAIPLFTSKAIRPLLAEEKGCANGLRFTKALPTALARSFGYDQAARIARECDFDEARMQRYLCGHSPSGR